MKNAIKQYVMVARKGDLEPGTGKTVDVNRMSVALFNVNGDYHAIHNSCPHEDGPLGEGELSRNVLPSPPIVLSGSQYGWRATASWSAM